MSNPISCLLYSIVLGYYNTSLSASYWFGILGEAGDFLSILPLGKDGMLWILSPSDSSLALTSLTVRYSKLLIQSQS